MISRETANTLLEEFSRQQEIEPLQLDDEEVALRELRALLTANLMWQDTQGATITLAPESDTVLLQQMWLPEQATADKLDAFLQSFALSLDFWTQRCATLGDTVMESEQPFYVKV